MEHGFQTFKIIFPTGEHSKNLNTYANIVEALADEDITKSDLILATRPWRFVISMPLPTPTREPDLFICSILAARIACFFFTRPESLSGWNVWNSPVSCWPVFWPSLRQVSIKLRSLCPVRLPEIILLMAWKMK